MVELDINDLQAIVEDSLYHFERSHPDVHAISLLQARTGLRVGEVLELSRWGVYDDEHLVVHVEKSENVRLVPRSDVPPFLLKQYLDHVPLMNRSYSSYTHLISKVLPRVYAGAGSNRVLSHLYRYHYARSLQVMGLDLIQIKTLMAHDNLESTQRYLSMPLFLVN